MRMQTIIPFLPGYMFNGYTLESTGVALKPTQHIHPETGEIVYYVRPLFEHGGAFVGMYIRHKGIVDWLENAND
jgi:predicted rRNA methylase YqxC with S4 and FtsJ domains